MKRRAEITINDRFLEEYERINKKPPATSGRISSWRLYKAAPSAFYMQAAALDGCDVHYILTGRRK